MITTATLSVCMIVRDEAEVLRSALESVRSIADQIVVVDTGSQDASPSVARECGAEVFDFAWCDDFAAARNAALEHATGDWVLVLDADEWIAAADRARLRATLDGPRDRVYECEQRNYVGDAATPGLRAGAIPAVWGVAAAGYVTARQVRLFPNDPRLRYQGCVHEQLEQAVRTAAFETMALDLTVHHLGKLRSAAIMQRKAQLYRLLGQMKLEHAPDGRALLELGVQCIELGEIARAAELLERALATSEVLGDRAKIIAHLAGVWSDQGDFERADALVRTHLETVSAYSFVWERWGSVLGRAGRTARAAEVLERASRLFDDAAGILRLLGETYLATRQYDRAGASYERLREQASGTGLGEAGLAVARAGAGDFEALRRLLERGSGPVTAAARAGALRWLGPEALLRAWPRRTAGAAELRILDTVLRQRGRSGVRVPGGPTPAPRTLEALWRGARANVDVAPEVYTRLLASVGLAEVAASPAHARRQIVQVPGNRGR